MDDQTPKRRVLIYDDDAVTLGRLLVDVALLGYEVVGTLHVREGTEALDDAPFDLLLARLNDAGYDLAVVASAKRPSVGVTFLIGTGAAPNGAFAHCAVLAEPLTPERLRAVLSRALATQAVKAAAASYIEAVRAACLDAGSSASTQALAAAAAHIETVRSRARA